jgi:hypothetical protein|eukprot:7317677-Prymnesium_polylepis.4
MTSKAIGNCFYEFHESPDDDKLRIFETPDVNAQWRLELLDLDMLGEDMPIRLRKLYSHWFEEQLGLVLFRAHTFEEKDIKFVLHVQTNACFRMPGDQQQQGGQMDWLAMERLADVDNFTERLVPTPNDLALLQVLSKFEDPGYVHVYLRAEPAIDQGGAELWRVELPRYKLVFELSRSQCGELELISKEHRGFRLATTQQLHSVLPTAFTTYLVLERRDMHDVTLPHMRLLMPDGLVLGGIPLRIKGVRCPQLVLACRGVQVLARSGRRGHGMWLNMRRTQPGDAPSVQRIAGR